MAIQPHAISTGRRPVSDYSAIAGDERVSEVRELAGSVAGMRLVHLAPADPPGAARDVLAATLPLMADLGIDAEWRAVEGGPGAARVARGLADGLRGAETAIEDSDWDEGVAAWAAAVAGTAGADLVVVHEAAGVLAGGVGETPVLWRLHGDLSSPDRGAWERAGPGARALGGCVVPLAGFAPPGLAERVLAPGIDPFAGRNRELPVKLAGDALRLLGLDLERPLCCQVGAIDAWGDPHSVIDAFRAARERAPGLQLVLAGGPRGGEGETTRLAGELADYARDVPDLHVLTDYAGVGELELNALQLLSRVALVAGLRSEVSLAAPEALWKRTPVVAVESPGIASQVRDGVDGRLCPGPDGLADALAELVSDPAAAIAMGSAGRAHVAERFLALRAVADELAMLAELGGGGGGAGPGATVRP